MLFLSTLIPTYRRPQDLVRCLEALKQQTRPTDELLVVVRDTDAETWAFLEAFKPDLLPLRSVTVSIPGQVAALNAGLAAAKGDIIAITDDDAIPYVDWLERIEAHFLSDDHVGGVGGRDWVYHGQQLEDGKQEVVGRVQWFGRVTANHHLGEGAPREVDILKGVNMSYRRSAIEGRRFDERLRGIGAQVHNDMAFSLALRRTCWKLIYDPKVAVAHYPAQRFDEDQRNTFNDIALINSVHNETLILLEHLQPAQRTAFLIWATLMGTRDALGVLQGLRFLPKEGALAGQKLLAALRGRWLAWCTWQQDGHSLNSFSTKWFHRGDAE
jgi:glycosyltransferase involved in cell wall biosynthesis